MNTIEITHENAQLLVDALWLLKSDKRTKAEQLKAIDELLEIVERLT
ncbi:hypothetical protein UFOVP453_36 [uncultured Caudovirales phage]|uniref:Uncharacterized protein n=1 Tax=uncultured Caudovirales phage TaxID=2100421 RepID=A0A6J5MGY4_9CAUD|nr:hypothetical protein UFOVP453_36 [uncultured Caudovirales phage]